MVIQRNRAPLRVAYIEDTSADAEALVRSWLDYRPKISNALDIYSTAGAYLQQLANPFPIYHDLILLDLNLPDLSGVELGRILKAQPELAEQSIVIVTASDARTAQAAQKLIGAEGWAEKPLRAAGILHEIGKIGIEAPWYGIEVIRRPEE